MVHSITRFFMGVVFSLLGFTLGGFLGWILMVIFCIELVTFDEVLNYLEGR